MMIPIRAMPLVPRPWRIFRSGTCFDCNMH